MATDLTLITNSSEGYKEYLTDTLMGKEVESSIRALFNTYYKALKWGIEHSDEFFMKDAKIPWIPMEGDDLLAWNEVFKIKDLLRGQLEKGHLFTADVYSNSEQAEISPDWEQMPKSTAKQIIPQGSRKIFRVNLPEKGHVMTTVQPLTDLDGVKIYFKPVAHLGGQGGNKGHLYNAFLAMHFMYTDKNGSLIVAPYYKEPTRVSEQFFSGTDTLGVSVWFNTSIIEGKGPKFETHINRYDDLMLGVDLHKQEHVSILQIPKDERARLFLWQLSQYIRPNLIKGSGEPVGLIESSVKAS